jgi:hypothetical protein
MKVLGSLAVAAALMSATPRAGAQTTECAPACLAGETCVGGVCMVPAQHESPPAEAAPDAAAPAPDAAPPEPPATPPPPVIVAPPPQVHRAARPAQTSTRARRGLLLMPFVGVHSIQDENSSGTDPGLRAGAFVGAFLNNDVSLNGALTFDLLNPNDSIAPLDLSRETLELTFSPLLHLGGPRVEFVVGPKLGFWNTWQQFSRPAPLAQSGDGTGQGWTMGANVGLLAAVTPATLAGILFNVELRDVIHFCETTSGQAERCSWGGSSSTLLGVSLAVLR